MAESPQPDTPRNRGDRDAPHVSPVTPAEDARNVLLNRVSWGAVLAGVVVALVAQLILNMIGIGIGASTLDPGVGADQNPSARGFSIGAALWWTVSGILAALAGGFAAGRLSGQPKEASAAWHGLTSWAFTTLVIFWLLTSTVGGLLGGAYRGLTSTAGGAIQTAAQTAAPALAGNAGPFDAVERTMRGAMGGNDPAALRDGAVAAMRAAATGDPQQADVARARAAEALAKAQNIPVEEARTQVQQYEQQYRQAVETTRREATEAAATATKAVSRGALIGAVSLLLGAVAAWFGGRMGAVDPTITGFVPTRRAMRQT
ncbi:MAG: PhnA-like protein [Rhodospirillales bacterium]|nr:PhnA-like protein [Rhodospirillales bacterium]